MQNSLLPQKRERFYSLDALRGLAALAIAFCWHARHFKVNPDRLFGGFSLFMYKSGYSFVEMFFILSGFVMAYVYKTRIAEKNINFKSYLGRRYKHIYPLHLFTLILVIGGQIIHLFAAYDIFVYKGNFNFFRIVMNLLLVQTGWIDNEQSLNGPAWCISVEIICYIIFYFVVKFTAKSSRKYYISCGALIIAALFVIAQKQNLPFMMCITSARGIAGFFIGVMLYEVYKNYYDIAKKVCTVAFPLLVAATIYVSVFPKPHLDIFGNHTLSGLIFSFPLLVMSCVCLNPVRRFLSLKPFILLGNISMSVYMCHFPVQLFFDDIDKLFKLNLDFSSWTVYLLFIAVTLIVSVIVHIFVENRNFLYCRTAIDKIFSLKINKK